MSGHHDILDEREGLSLPLAASVVVHVGAVAAVLALGLVTQRVRPSFGDPNAITGGSVAITPVKQPIPLQTNPGLHNPVASDTESRIPQPPPKPKPQAKKQDPDAIALKSRTAPKPPSETPSSQQKYRPRQEEPPSQLQSDTGQRMTSAMFNVPGSGGVGVGTGNPFGNRFGAYAALVRDRVAQRWRTNDVDRSLQSAPPVIVLFEISRDGSVRGVRVVQRSGNYGLDMSSQRAVIEAAPMPPLPREYERDTATIEFWFQLQR